MSERRSVGQLLRTEESGLLADWLVELSRSLGRGGAAAEAEFRNDCAEFLRLLALATESGSSAEIDAPALAPLREHLGRFSRARGAQGFTPSETASFVFTLRRPLLARVREAYADDPTALFAELTSINELLDRLGLHTTEVYQKGREDVISRQQREMLELSTPVVKLWDGVLALPLIGTLDSERTQIVMETLLQRIVDTGSEIAIIDITGVPTVDTLVAQHLLKTVAAARLMGADCIISGVRPQIAQTIVHLGVDLGNIVTKANLADALSIALQRRGLTIGRATRT